MQQNCKYCKGDRDAAHFANGLCYVGGRSFVSDRALQFHYDDRRDLITIEGVEYQGEYFRERANEIRIRQQIVDAANRRFNHGRPLRISDFASTSSDRIEDRESA